MRRSRSLAGTLANLRQLDEADAWFRKADECLDRVLAKEPANASARYLAGRAGINYGAWVLERQGRRRDAIDRYRSVIANARTLVADYPNVARYQRLLSSGLSNAGQMLRELDDRGAALPLLDESVVVSRRGLELSPDDAGAKTFLNNQLRKLAETLLETRRYADALARAEELAALPFGGFYPPQQAAYVFAACVPWARERGADAEAERYAERALELLRRALEQGLDHPGAVANPWFDAIRERPAFVEIRAELTRRLQAEAGK